MDADQRLIVEVRDLDFVVSRGGLDRCVRPLVLLHHGPKHHDGILKTTLLGWFGCFGGGEGEVGVLGRGHQVLVLLVMSVVCQINGVARRRRLGIADGGLDVGKGDLAHFEL